MRRALFALALGVSTILVPASAGAAGSASNAGCSVTSAGSGGRATTGYCTGGWAGRIGRFVAYMVWYDGYGNAYTYYGPVRQIGQGLPSTTAAMPAGYGHVIAGRYVALL